MWSEVADKARVYDKQTDKSLQSTSKKTQEEETALEGCGWVREFEEKRSDPGLQQP